MRGMWNNVNPYSGYTNNPYMMPPYMPMYGYNQPAVYIFIVILDGRELLYADGWTEAF